MNVKSIIDEKMEDLEDQFEDFLDLVKAEDTLLSRAAFYGMIRSGQEDRPDPNSEVQELLMKRIVEKHRQAISNLLQM